MLGSWLGVTLTCIPVAVYTGLRVHHEGGRDRVFCQQPHEPNLSLKLYSTALFALFYLFPLVMTIVTLISTRRTAQQEPEPETASCRPDVEIATRAGKLRRALIAALVLFAICRLPMHMTQLAETILFSRPSVYTFGLSIIAQSLFFLNCGLNPVVQILVDRPVKTDFIPLTAIIDKPVNQNK